VKIRKVIAEMVIDDITLIILLAMGLGALFLFALAIRAMTPIPQTKKTDNPPFLLWVTTLNLRSIALAWMLMWGLSYIFVAMVAPEIAGDTALVGASSYAILGLLIFLAVILLDTKYEWIGKILFCILGAIMVFGGVTSWIGMAVWNVPFADKALFQVSMAFADLISAVFMFVLVLEDQ